MHSTHFIIASGQTEGEVRANVACELDNYGNEDNWYDIMRIINLSDNSNPSDTEYLQAVVDDLNKVVAPNKKQDIIDQISILQSQLSDGGRHVYWQLSDLYKELYNLTGVSNLYTVDDIRNNTCYDYNSFTYEEFGLTSWADELDENERLYLLEINMHS